jgi:hypothetical protein
VTIFVTGGSPCVRWLPYVHNGIDQGRFHLRGRAFVIMIGYNLTSHDAAYMELALRHQLS